MSVGPKQALRGHEMRGPTLCGAPARGAAPLLPSLFLPLRRESRIHLLLDLEYRRDQFVEPQEIDLSGVNICLELPQLQRLL
jgi:hypothetical protein